MHDHHIFRLLARDSTGKGTLGCVFFIALLGLAAYAGTAVVPVYYAHRSLETDVNSEVSRAGSHFLDDEQLLKNILDSARRNEIRLAREDIKIERFAGKVHVAIHYAVPIDLVVYRRALDFNIRASSLIGRL